MYVYYKYIHYVSEYFQTNFNSGGHLTYEACHLANVQFEMKLSSLRPKVPISSWL